MLHKILLQPEVALLEVSDVVHSTCLQSSHGLNDFSDVMYTRSLSKRQARFMTSRFQTSSSDI